MYAVDESIRFWIGVTSEVEIPEALQAPCVLHWIRPDGNKFDEPIDWPGGAISSWKGGWGFGKHTPKLGRYVVSFECAGRKTDDQTFLVVPNPLSGLFAAHWIVKSNGATSRQAALLVENNTNRLLRFAKSGLPDSDVWLEIRTSNSPGMQNIFAPASALLRPDEIPPFSLEMLDWNTKEKWPMVRVPGGDSAERVLALDDLCPFGEDVQYQVGFNTVLTIFVGESTDSGAQLFPLRMPVSATEYFH